MTPEFLTPVDSSASDLFVHGNPLAGCNMSPDNEVNESHNNLYSRFVPGTMDRYQNKRQVLFLNSLGQQARETWRSNIVCFLNHRGPCNYLITRAEAVGSNMLSTHEDATTMSNENINFLFQILFYSLCRDGTTQSVSMSILTCFSTLINALYCFHSSSAFINQIGSNQQHQECTISCIQGSRYISPHSLIMQASFGRLFGPVATFSIFLTTSRPSPSTLPKTTCLLSSQSHFAHVIKN